MEIQRVEEITDTEQLKDSIKAGSNSTIVECKTNIHSQSSSPDHTDHTTQVQFDQRLHLSEDSPDVFKRIRYISRWETREESRGSMRFIKRGNGLGPWWSSGPMHLWSATCTEAEVIKDTLAEVLKKTLPDDLLYGGTWERAIALNLFFAGPTIQQSRPLIMVFSLSKSARDGVEKEITKLDWVQAHPSLIYSSSYSLGLDDIIKIGLKIRYGIKYNSR